MTASDHLSPDQFGPLVIRHEQDELSEHERVSGWFQNDDDDHRVAGYISHKPAPDGSSTFVRVLHVEEDRRRLGVASGLMSALESRYPHIEHGERTPEGVAWWNMYRKAKR